MRIFDPTIKKLIERGRLRSRSRAWRTALLLFVSFRAFSWPFSVLAEPFSFDDIEFWVGTGENRAALVIDWFESDFATPALVWGYRWNGTASGADMLVDIVAADERLFAKLGDSPMSIVRTFGFGYDADNDGEFGIDDGTQFDAEGLAFSGPADLATSIDVSDYYSEGWFTGFWHYSVASANPYGSGAWSDTTLGMASRMLADGAWDSWVFSPSFNFSSFAENPLPAMAPPAALAGDFNGDASVDALDYDVWGGSFGSQSDLSADANGNGIVDMADYTVWRDQCQVGMHAVGTHHVPEPMATQLWIAAIATIGTWITRGHGSLALSQIVHSGSRAAEARRTGRRT